jgi:hypothetical protein
MGGPGASPLPAATATEQTDHDAKRAVQQGGAAQ